MTVSRRDFLKTIGITSGCFTFGGAGLFAAPKEIELTSDEYIEAKKEVYRQLYGGSPSGTNTEPYVKGIEVINSPYYRDPDSCIPEAWAQTALRTLHKNMVVGNLVHRDFEHTVSEYGDVVNVYKPKNFITRRMTDDDPFDEPVTSTLQRIVTPLDAHFYSSFIICDGDAAKSFQDLVKSFVYPAMDAMARNIDQYTLEKMADGNKNFVAGHDVQELILDARMRLNESKTFVHDRHMIVPLSWCLPRFVDTFDPSKYLGFNIREDIGVEQGIAFHREALALVNRPLKVMCDKIGVRSAAASSNDISIRCSMQYDSLAAGTRVTFDTLFGAAVLEPDMIVVANKQKWAKHGQYYYDTGVDRPRFISPLDEF